MIQGGVTVIDKIVIKCLNMSGDRYYLKKEKVADVLFDLVKYLLTTIGAIILLTKEKPTFEVLFITFVIIVIVFTIAVLITPMKED